jgi:small-conductance mechanosensitive channel
VNELLATFLSYLPRIIGALAIVGVGFVLAVVARRGTALLLRRLRFDEVCERAGLTALMRRGGIQSTPARFAGTIIFYAVFLLAILTALGSLGLDFLAATLNQIILYAPRVLAAVLILLFGSSAAGVVAELAVRTLSEVGVSRTEGLKSLVRFGITFVAAILAAAVLGIDVTILLVVTVIGLGAVALTVSLALGLGLRGLSKNVAASRYVSEGIEEGDEISVNGVSGTVERLGYAMTTIRGPNGRVYIVPNAYFLEHVVEKEEASPGTRENL